MAFDLLSIPATSCSCERIFSSTKKMISPAMGSLKDDTIELRECLRQWLNGGLIELQLLWWNGRRRGWQWAFLGSWRESLKYSRIYSRILNPGTGIREYIQDSRIRSAGSQIAHYRSIIDRKCKCRNDARVLHTIVTSSNFGFSCSFLPKNNSQCMIPWT